MKEYLEKILGNNIKEQDWGLIADIVSCQKVTQGDHLISIGERCHKIWYLEQGAVRFYENQNGEYKTIHFAIAPTMFTVYESLITGTPSYIGIEASCQLNVEVLPYQQLKKIYDKSHAIERVGRIMAEHNFLLELNRRRTLLSKTAIERYELIEANQPEVFDYFQLKDIATYIGITPVSLSRIRASRFQGK